MGVRTRSRRTGENRRSQLIVIGLVSVALAAVAGYLTEDAMQPSRSRRPQVLVYTDIWCRDCTQWIIYLGASGFEVESRYWPDREQMHGYLGVQPALRGPFVALVEGYVIEGHVPAEDIRRLLRERPEARGLAVPGRPGASPGMERYSLERAPYEVILFGAGGPIRTYARH